MKFFDRFFGGRTPEEEPENVPVPETPREPRNLQDQEHKAKALGVLLSLHNEKKNDDSLMGILRCLMENPPVWVPTADANIQIPEVTCNESGERVLPIFTSMNQVAESYRCTHHWEQMLFQELKPFLTREAKLTGVLINGFSHEFLLHRMTFPMFFAPEGDAVDVVPHPVKEDQHFVLTPAGREADALKEAAVRFLAANNCEKAYFAKLNNNGEESYLFAIDQTDRPNSEFFKLMHQELSKVDAKLPIDYAPYKDFCKHITADNCRMIYRRKAG